MHFDGAPPPWFSFTIRNPALRSLIAAHSVRRLPVNNGLLRFRRKRSPENLKIL